MTATSPIRTLIVDDEPMARARLRRQLALREDFVLAGEAGSVAEAVAAVGHLRPDLVLLDIRLPDGTGFDLVDRIGPDALPLIVFVTAHGDRALDAFRVNAVDYLLKPLSADEFQSVLDRVRKRRSVDEAWAWAERLVRTLAGGDRDASDPAEPPLERLIIRERDRICMVPIDDVEWIQGAGNYVEIRAGDRTYLDRRTLQELERRLDPGKFVRIHRSTIVARAAIREVRPGESDAYQVTLASGMTLRMSRAHARQVLGQE
jgi:two-component system LytT family response regulator